MHDIRKDLTEALSDNREQSKIVLEDDKYDPDASDGEDKKLLLEPSAYVKKFPGGEDKWKRAKAIAAKSDYEDKWALTTHIFKKMVGVKESSQIDAWSILTSLGLSNLNKILSGTGHRPLS